MLKTILVPLDGSVLAARSLRFATRLARASGAELLLLHARPELNPVFFAHRESWEMAAVRERIAVHEIEVDLAALAEQLRGEGVSASSSMEVGEPAQVILDAVRARQADLVVMSTLGRGSLGRWLYGSVADAVLRRVSIPVLLIPAACERSWPEDRRPRLLIPLDGSAFAEEVLRPARELSRLLDAECLLLRVIEPTEVQAARPHPADEGGVQAALAETERYLQTMAAPLRATDVEVRVHVEAGSPTTAIAAVARQERADLIAMATHGRGGLARLVMGSVATATLQQACVPVLLVRPATVRQASYPLGGGARPATVVDHPVVSLALTPRELDVLRRVLRGLEYAAEGNPQLVEPIRGLRAKIEAAETASDASGVPLEPRREPNNDRRPGGPSSTNPC